MPWAFRNCDESRPTSCLTTGSSVPWPQNIGTDFVWLVIIYIQISAEYNASEAPGLTDLSLFQIGAHPLKIASPASLCSLVSPVRTVMAPALVDQIDVIEDPPN